MPAKRGTGAVAVVQVRLTIAERAALVDACRATRSTMSEFVRRAVAVAIVRNQLRTDGVQDER